MAKNEIIKCPVCSKTLTVQGSSYVCDNKHTFDIASKGYVNLLLSNQKNSKEPGDNKQMIIARNTFLNTGFYKRLSESINSIALQHLKEDSETEPVNILDAGCGEGYYIDSLEKSLESNNNKANLFGFDISKAAIRIASSRSKNIWFAIASSYNIPITSKSIGCLLQLFAPCCDSEFNRVLKDDGIAISVIPGKRHLLGLKELLYDDPYVNDEVEYPLISFKPINKTHIEYDITLEDQDSIKNLLMMTPYYWRTNIQKINKLYEISILKTPVEFIITTYKKIVP